jgi:cupin 2 domain-containing protein
LRHNRRTIPRDQQHPGERPVRILAGNLFDSVPASLPDELSEDLLSGGEFQLRRIVSLGHATPAGEWYDQEDDEWVVLLCGSAGLRIERDPDVRVLQPNDWLLLPAHVRHRVEWTDDTRPTVWLALHCRCDAAPG